MLFCNFLKDIREYVILDLKNLGKYFNKLDCLTDEDIILKYMNWKNRFINNNHREVFISNELLSKLKYKDSIDFFKKLFEKGNNLEINKFLSKKVKTFYNSKTTSHAKDKDTLLNEWGIYHLHLNLNSKDLLFLLIDGDKVYFIDILPHQNFGGNNLFAIIENNWKFLLPKIVELDGEDSAVGWQNHERKKLRDAGVSTLYTGKTGDVYIPKYGISTSGDSIANMDKICYIGQLLEKIEIEIRYSKNINIDKIWNKYNCLNVKLFIDETESKFEFKELNSKNIIEIVQFKNKWYSPFNYKI